MVASYMRPLIMLAGAIAVGAQAAPAAETARPTIAGWDEFVDALRDLPARMLARLPEAQRNDP